MMQILFHGSRADEGWATLVSLVLIFILSFLLLSVIPSISARKKAALAYRTTVIESIEKENTEVRAIYDFN
jgi:competence protein ComGC